MVQASEKGLDPAVDGALESGAWPRSTDLRAGPVGRQVLPGTKETRASAQGFESERELCLSCGVARHPSVARAVDVQGAWQSLGLRAEGSHLLWKEKKGMLTGE